MRNEELLIELKETYKTNSYEKLFEEVIEESSIFSIVQKKFSELSELFQEFCIPYLFIKVDEDDKEKLDEAETVVLKDKYEQFKVKIKQLVKIMQSFMVKSQTPLLSENLVNHMDADLYEAVRIFEELDLENRQQLEKIRSAHAAFIMLARLLNTSIKAYNEANPTHKLEQLHNIPNPQFYESANTRLFFSNFIKDLEKLP